MASDDSTRRKRKSGERRAGQKSKKRNKIEIDRPGLFESREDYTNFVNNIFDIPDSRLSTNLSQRDVEPSTIQNSGPRGLTSEQIKTLRRHDRSGIAGQCAICVEDYVVAYRVRTLPCKHYFHVKCIDPWLERNASCPTCRAVIII